MKRTDTRRGEFDLQFHAAFESLPVGVAHLSLDGRVLHANSRLAALVGQAPEALPGLPLPELVVREDLQAAAPLTLQLRRGRVDRLAREMCLLHREGYRVAARVSLSLQRDAGGRAQHFTAVVDEGGVARPSAPAAVHLSEGRLSRALGVGRMDVFEYEPPTGRASRQGPLAHLLGLQHDCSGAEFFALIHPEDRAGLLAVHERLRPGRSEYSYEFRVRTLDGSQLWLADQARGEFDAQGRLLRVVGVCADITQRKAVAEALAQERELLKQTLDSIPVMLCLFDARGRQTLFNRHFEAVLGWGANDLQTPENFLGLLYPEAGQRDEALQTLYAAEPSRRETVVRAKDGTCIPCEWTHLRLADDTKIIIGWDLRERRANEERLQRLAERQALLLELSSSMLQSNQDEAALARAVFERIGAHLGADLCFNYRADTPSGALHLVAGFGIPTGMQRAFQQLQPGQSLSNAVAAEGQSLIVDETHIAQHKHAAMMRAMGVRAYVGHPLYARDGRVLGTFALASTRRGAFTPEEVDFFQTVCHFVTQAWKRNQSERELHKREQQYRMALEVGKLGNWQRELLDSDIYHLDAQCQHHYGVDKADVPKWEILERIHPQDLPRVEQFIARARTQRIGQPSERIEYRVVHPDGQERWLAVHAKLVLEQRNGVPVLVRHGITADITERKRTEQALRETMADLRRAQAVAHVGSWRVDPEQGSLSDWSEEARRILGLVSDRPLAFNELLALVHPEDRERVRAQRQASLSGAAPYDIEHRIVVGSQVRWVRCKDELEFDRQGRLLRGLGTVQDITERKKVEEALRESEARLQALADSMPQLAWQADPQGEIVYCNLQHQRFFGLVPNADGRFSWTRVLHPDDLLRTVNAWQEAVRSQTPYEIEHRLQQVDGRYCWYLTRAVPVRDAEGQVVQWYGASTDIEACKQGELAIQEAAARIRAIVETAVEGILTLDEQGCVDSVNPAVEHLFGYTAAELLGQNVSMLIPQLAGGEAASELDAGQEAPHWSALLLQGGELQGCRKDGSFFPMELSISETPLPSRRIFTTLVRDISERKAQEAALRLVVSRLAEADRSKDQFLAILAHELRNPLGPLRNAAQLLRFKGVGEAHISWCAHAIERQVRHLTRLIDDLLDASRVSHNMLQLRKERVTLREVVEDAVEGSRSLIEQRQHQLSVELPPSEVSLDADPVRLTQVFQNLLDNAAKYTPCGGHLELSAKVEAAQAVIAVRDDGIGIPPESQARLFEMFFQVGRSTGQVPAGLGIGLTLVQRLVQMHGGTIEAHSEGTGRGSTFVVRLPLPAVPPSSAQRSEAAEGPSGEGRRPDLTLTL